MRRRMGSSVLRWVRTLTIVFVFATLLGVGSGAQAQEAGVNELGGYQGEAAASGVHLFYEPQGLLPTSPPIDLGSPDALTTIATGPLTFARAGVADPGDLLANPDALLALGSPDYPAGTIPSWPLRITANSSFGEPEAESNPAPGLAARVEATDGESHAQATMPGAAARGVVTVASASSSSTSRTDGSTVTVEARTETSGFDLLGLIEIESVVTELTGVADGVTTEVSGGTTITRATVLGQPATIDAEGIHIDDGGQPSANPLGVLDGLTGDLEETLAQAGISVTLAEPITLGDDSTAKQLASAGLRIDLEISEDTQPAIAALAELVPPLENPAPGTPGVEDLLAVAQARHLTSVQVGAGEVSLEARPTVAFDFAPVDIDTGAAGANPVPSLSAPAAAATPSPQDVAGTPSGDAATAVPTATSGDVPVGAGIAGLVVLALLSQPLLGDRLARAAAVVLGEGGSNSCATGEER